MKRIIFSILMLGYCTLSAAQTETTTLRHADLEPPLIFNVHLPEDYHASPHQKFSLLFDFHPQADKYLKGMHFWLTHNSEWPWPATVIVTPAPGNPVGRLYRPDVEATPLIDFIATDLVAHLEQQYRLNGFRIMSGFRINASLALATFIHYPGVFDAHIVSCPELSDNHDFLLTHTKQKLGSLAQPGFLYLTCGDTIKTPGGFEALGEYRRILNEQAPENISWQVADLSGHEFMSYPLLTLITGIEQLFSDINQGLPPTSEISVKGTKAIMDYYQWLSDNKYGYSVSAEPSIRSRADYLLENNLEQAALTIGKEYTNHYPQSAYSWFYLAKAQQLAEMAEAANSQRRAVRLAKEHLSNRDLNKMQAFLSELTQD